MLAVFMCLLPCRVFAQRLSSDAQLILAHDSAPAPRAMAVLFAIGSGTRSKHVRKGAVVGGLVGVATGVAIGSRLQTGDYVSSSVGSSERRSRVGLVAIAGSTGGLLGSAVGALVGLVMPVK